MNEGYIKFQAIWQQQPPLPENNLQDLIACRNELYQLGLIGVYPNGIGYGNISQRLEVAGQFIISGSATGHLPMLSSQHFTTVTKVNIVQNTVWCAGPVIASSETMSHAVIYQTCPEVNAVIHVHHAALWQQLLHRIPTTGAGATYGSPEMADSIVQLLQTTDLRRQQIFVMEGHPEGIFAFGGSLWEVTERLGDLAKERPSD
jgi:ribulose-5-phosphate 4-epimerase/fuculose-1-phosphate aldolase